MIKINNVSKIYKTRKVLKKSEYSTGVRNLDLEIPAGAYGLLGINGAGKTTTLKMIATLLRPSSGSIQLDGFDTVQDEKVLRSQINMITGSDRMLYFRLTGKENLFYFSSLYGMSYRESKKRVDELLSLTGLASKADKRVETYSRGMKQRLTIARGLINNPRYLLLDEPTLGLDVAIAVEIRNFIKEILVSDEKRTIILTSHYMSEIEQICKNVGILQQGSLIFDGTYKELFNLTGLKEKHHFSFSDQRLLNKINQLIALDESSVIKEGNKFIITVDKTEGYHLLKNIEFDGTSGLEYTQRLPSLEDAIIKLSAC